MSSDTDAESRWSDNALSGLSDREKKEKINEHNALVRKYNRLLTDSEKKKLKDTLVDDEEHNAEMKKMFKDVVSFQRDRRLVLYVLVHFEKKTNSELLKRFGYGPNIISSMNKAITNNAILEEINRDQACSEKNIQEHSESDKLIFSIKEFVENLCETYPMKKRGKTHYVRGPNVTILSLYNEYVLYCEKN